METEKSKVYIKTDEQGRIIRCEGGYTMSNIQSIEDWMLIDEGTGDKYNLCQSHYFPGGLYTMDGIPWYKLLDGKPVLRADEEIEADRAARPEAEPTPTPEERIADLEEALDLLLSGVTE